MGVGVGIDLGTTNSCVSVVQADRARVVEDKAGRRIQPSVISFHPDGSVLAGYAAKDRLVIDTENTIYSFKRLLGRNFESPEMKKILNDLPYAVKEGPGGIPAVEVRGREVSLPEVSAMMLRHLREMSSETLGVEADQAVITVPANFNDVQRSSTKVAGRIAGYKVLRILNEPTAAALAYGFGSELTERVAIYDFGGGTFDITIIELADDVFEVLSTAGDSYLGGDDFDEKVASSMRDQFLKEHRYDLGEDPMAMQRVRSVAEKIKCQLSSLKEVQATLRELAYGPGGASLDFNFRMSRPRFESLIEPMVERSLKVCDEALKLAGIDRSSLDSLVLVGGTTRVPMVRERVAEFFGITPRTEINPDEVVAIGAAIHAFSLTGEQLPEDLPTPKPGGPMMDQAGLARAARDSKPPPPRRPSRPPPAPPSAGGRSGTAMMGAPGTSAAAKSGTMMMGAATATNTEDADLPAPKPPKPKKPAKTAMMTSRGDPAPAGLGVPAEPEADTWSGVLGAGPGQEEKLKRSSTDRPPPMVASIPPGQAEAEPPAPAPPEKEDPFADIQKPAAPPAKEDPFADIQKPPAAAAEDPFAGVQQPPAEKEDPFAEVEAPPDQQGSFPEQLDSSAVDEIDLDAAPVPSPEVEPPTAPAQIAPPVDAAMTAEVEAEPMEPEPLPEPAVLPDPADLAPPPAEPPGATEVEAPEPAPPADPFDAIEIEAPEPEPEPAPAPPVDPFDAIEIEAPEPEPAGLPDPADLAPPPAEPEPPQADPFANEPPAAAAAPPVPPPVIPAAGSEAHMATVAFGDPFAEPSEGAAPPIPPLPVGDAQSGSTVHGMGASVPPPLPEGGGTQSFGDPFAEEEPAPPPAVEPPPPADEPPPFDFGAPATPSEAPFAATAAQQALHQEEEPLPPEDVIMGEGPVDHEEIPAESYEMPMVTSAKPALLLDVTPRALGVATAGGFCDTIIERNAAIPVEQGRVFTTSHNDQTEVAVDVYQGESRRAEENTKLGQVLLTNLRPARRGEIKVRVTFEIDTDGILGVSARNEETGEAQATRIVLSGGLDDNEVEALVEKYSE